MGTTSPWWLGSLLVETEPARITVELGFVGLLLMFGLLRAFIFFVAVRCTLSFKDPIYRALGIGLTAHLGFGILNTIVLNVTAGLYYWGALGLMLAMQRLEHTGRAPVSSKLAAEQLNNKR